MPIISKEQYESMLPGFPVSYDQYAADINAQRSKIQQEAEQYASLGYATIGGKHIKVPKGESGDGGGGYDWDDPLSLTDAEKLGVPFGTTKRQAQGMTSMEDWTPEMEDQYADVLLNPDVYGLGDFSSGDLLELLVPEKKQRLSVIRKIGERTRKQAEEAQKLLSSEEPNAVISQKLKEMGMADEEIQQIIQNRPEPKKAGAGKMAYPKWAVEAFNRKKAEIAALQQAKGAQAKGVAARPLVKSGLKTASYLAPGALALRGQAAVGQAAIKKMGTTKPTLKGAATILSPSYAVSRGIGYVTQKAKPALKGFMGFMRGLLGGK